MGAREQMVEVCLEELKRNPKAWRGDAAARLSLTLDQLDKRLRTDKKWKTVKTQALKELEKDPSPMDPTHPELRDLERKIQESRTENAQLRAKLKEADANKSVFEQAAAVIRQEVKPWTPQLLTLSKPQAGQFLVDGAVALTDEHADEIIRGAATWGLERYNFDVFRIRLMRYVKVLGAYITQHLPRYNFERLWVMSLGDKIHGNLHLPGQQYRNHFANDLRASIAVAEAEADAIAQILQFVPHVVMVCVSGNHPRRTAKKDYGDPHDNHDFLCAALMEARLRNYIEEGRLEIFAPKSWSAYCEIRGRVHCLNHGDDVKGTWGIPWYGFSKKENRVQALVGRKDVRVDYFWYGHYHTDMSVTESGARGIHAAAWTLTSDFSINAIASGSEPSQPLEVLDEEHGRILEVPIYLRDEVREQKYWDGDYTPELGRPVGLEHLALADALAEAGGFPLIKAS